MANRLLHESSLYLQGHADNPVDWYPWGEEAFARARTENKPLLVSIGYSSCHWCHVMEHESFENVEIAAIMNKLFVNIKVDREERPDVDEIYMNAVQLISGHGGWPLHVFLTPDLKPFFGGTYFPPTERRGLIGWPMLLERVAAYYHEHHQKMLEDQEALFKRLQSLTLVGQGGGTSVVFSPERTRLDLEQSYDSQSGGFGRAPKFPHATDIQFLLNDFVLHQNSRSRVMAEHTLKCMADGGMHDVIGGGFHRYSTDGDWRVPHYEKMLYDNALLLSVYAQAACLFNDELFSKTAEGIVRWALDEMRLKSGTFASALDADSEGVEGKFYIFYRDEIVKNLGEGSLQYFVSHGSEVIARSTLPESFRQKLFLFRQDRLRPLRDDKVLLGWNGLFISGLSHAAQILQREDWLEVAVKAADVLWQNLVTPDEVYRVLVLNTAHLASGRRIHGTLEDAAYFTEALINLFEASGNPLWLKRAEQLQNLTDKLFWDEQRKNYYSSLGAQSDLILRSTSPFDGATPSPATTAISNQWRLSRWLADSSREKKAEDSLAALGEVFSQMPRALLRMQCLLQDRGAKPLEVVVTGSRQERVSEEFRKILAQNKRPGLISVFVDTDKIKDNLGIEIIPLQQKTDLKIPRAFVCEKGSCQPPMMNFEDLEKILRDR